VGAEGRVFESSGDFKVDMATLNRKEADGWKQRAIARHVPADPECSVGLTVSQFFEPFSN
jgi:hypothetical protein